MYAPLPEGLIAIVRPPKIWESLGLVPPGTLWTLQRAVYGLRCAPRAWGTYRDKELRGMRWQHSGKTYQLVQCVNDAQVWKICQEGWSAPLGLLLMYVDDFMLLSPADEVQAGLIKELQKKSNMSTNVFLSPATPMTFLGMEIERESKTGDLLIHQQSFVRQLLTKHGIDRTSNR